MKRILKWIALALAVLVILVFFGGLWFSSNQLLYPSFHGAGGDLSVCKPETEKYFGPKCGNLRATQQYRFSEVRIPGSNGYALPGWLIKATENGRESAHGVIMLVPAGGSDRREETRYIGLFLAQGLDVLTVDLGCQGEAPCPVPGLSYGEREAKDVASAYAYLTNRYDRVYVMGSSVGAAAILIALPQMPRLAGAIAENPFASFDRLIREAPQSKSMPGWATALLLRVAKWRGRFTGSPSPIDSVSHAGKTPVLFIHSKTDQVVAYRRTEQLAAAYPGSKAVWIAERGEHAGVWDANQAEFERRVAEFLANTN